MGPPEQGSGGYCWVVKTTFKMLIIYHSADLDGICSGAILHKRFPDARLLGYDYRDPFDVEENIENDERVIMADVSMPMDVMEQIAQRSGMFRWIDHHPSAHKDFMEHFGSEVMVHQDGGMSVLDGDLKYIYEEGRAACELCWEFVSDDPIPEPVILLGKYDTWRGNGTPEWDNRILPFQYGMRVGGYTPESLADWWLRDMEYTEEKVGKRISIGEGILKYQKQQDERLMLKSFDARLNVPGEPIRCLVCNGAYNSTAFESKWDESKYDIMAGISYDGKMWGVSLRTTKDIDLSVIAKSFGGGGHKKAAGCGVDDLRKIFVW